MIFLVLMQLNVMTLEAAELGENSSERRLKDRLLFENEFEFYQ